ncbi:RHS repeat-associated core domain-containing protein [Chryseobacterium flavum]|uniref:RHS repeat-associated core domain-containing protein n=2 Tax=Chryseobacterium flavum TaxID=415851 RepID=UPI002FDA3CDA
MASPLSNIAQLLSVNYYDSYPPGSPAVTNVFAQPLLKDDPSQNRSTKGLPVASYVKNIEDDNWTKTYTWYDTKGRVIGSRSINHLGGYTVLNHKLDFSGTILQTNTYHKRLASDTQRNIVEYFTYDSQNRLTMHRHKVDSNPVEILAQNKYNELSQLESKKVGGVVATSPLQQVDYKYNIRGWMTKINDPANLNGKLFGYEMRYQSPVNTLFAIGRYNGNIAEIDWRTSKDDVLKRYSYSYDSLNRLNYGHYSEPNGTVPEEDHFGETTEYDLNGNITRLYRNTKNTTNGLAMQIDNLTYTYSGNQLTKVTDASQNYSGYTGGGNTITYDLNGNMISHLDKGLNEIKYNFLNLPVLVKKNNNSGAFGSLSSYLYRTDGTKLKKIYSYYKSDWQANTSLALTTTDYLDGFQYVLESSGLGCLDCPPVSPTLQFMPTAEGYFDFVKNKYIYNYVDHLGNIRLSYFNDGTATVVLDENNYYPFGLKHEGVNVLTGNPAYQYKYNGKELQETGMYDYGARFYMPDIGRFGTIDPLAEKYPDTSPFTYVANNPIKYTDPTGMWIDIKDGDNTYRYNNGKYYTQNAETKKWDVEASVKSDSYAGQILSALTSITGGDENSFGSQYLNLFANDDINTTIKDSSLNGSNAGKNGAALDGGTVFTAFKQDVTLDTTSGSKQSPFHVTLFHELGHSFSNQVFDNNILRSEWTTIPQESGDRKIPKSEVYSSTIENVLRAEQNLPLRLNYSPGTTNTQLIQKVSTVPLINNVIYKLNPATQNIFNSIIQSKKSK